MKYRETRCVLGTWQQVKPHQDLNHFDLLRSRPSIPWKIYHWKNVRISGLQMPPGLDSVASSSEDLESWFWCPQVSYIKCLRLLVLSNCLSINCVWLSGLSDERSLTLKEILTGTSFLFCVTENLECSSSQYSTLVASLDTLKLLQLNSWFPKTNKKSKKNTKEGISLILTKLFVVKDNLLAIYI